MFSSGPRYDKLKTNLRLAINRMKLLQKKKTEEALKARKEIADYLKAGKPERARIRVEHIVREDYMVEALELLEMYCDLLLARFGMIQNMKEVDSALEEPVCTLIWCAPRLFSDVQELKPIAEQLTHKYGPKYVDEFCRHESSGKVSERVRKKLSIEAPPAILVEHYLVEIAKTYNVDYQPDQRIMAQAEASSAQAQLFDFVGSQQVSSGIPAPVSAAQFDFDSKPSVPHAGPFVSQPGAFTGVSSQPPPYRSNANTTYDNELNDGDYAKLPPPGNVQPSAPADYSLGGASSNATAPPPAAGFNFVLPDVPSALTPTPNAGGSNSGDVDFDELERRFAELKKKK